MGGGEGRKWGKGSVTEVGVKGVARGSVLPVLCESSGVLCPDRDTLLDVSARYLWVRWVSGSRVQWLRRGLNDQVETEDERDQGVQWRQ